MIVQGQVVFHVIRCGLFSAWRRKAGQNCEAPVCYQALSQYLSYNTKEKIGYTSRRQTQHVDPLTGPWSIITPTPLGFTSLVSRIIVFLGISGQLSVPFSISEIRTWVQFVFEAS